MANEWKWCQFNWSQATHNSQVLMDRIEVFMLAAGYLKAAYSDLDDRYFVRADHATRDNWHYTGDGGTQRCGIYIRDLRYNGGAYTGTARITVKAFVENILENGVHVATPDTTGDLRIDFHTSKNHTITLIGGEDGLEVEFGVDGLNGNVALGFIATHQVWPELNGTREAERKWASQGLVFDLFGNFRMTANRDNRMARDDGSNLNATANLRGIFARSNTNVTAVEQGTVNGYSAPVINWDLFLSMNLRNGFVGSSPSGFGLVSNACTFGLMATPFDDRWRLCPLVVLQSYSGVRETGVVSSAGSVTLAPNSGQGGTWVDGRNLLRKIPRFFAVSHLLAPWQLLTDDSTAKVYRIVRAEDGGRVVCIAVEWPGAGQEVAIP